VINYFETTEADQQKTEEGKSPVFRFLVYVSDVFIYATKSLLNLKHVANTADIHDYFYILLIKLQVTPGKISIN